MRLQFNETLENENTEGMQTFGIKGTAAVYKILYKDIYTNIPMAVLRETITNGIDAMKEVGTIETKKLKITMPRNAYTSNYEPRLIIRDYGSGLDEEGVKRIYTYGYSSRNDSNEYTGAFGIGAKAPFAYTDHFSIVSYRNGIRDEYEARMINSIPTIKKISSSDTVEENGVEISLDVSETDSYQFGKELNKLFRYYPYSIDCNIQISPDRNTVIFENDIVRIEDAWNNEIFVLSGGILYAGFNSLDLFDRESDEYSDFKRGFQKYNTIIIKAPVGRYNIHPSREKIDNCFENKERMKLDIEIAKESFLTKVKDKLSNNINTYGINAGLGKMSTIANNMFSGFLEMIDGVGDLYDSETKKKFVKIASTFKSGPEVRTPLFANEETGESLKLTFTGKLFKYGRKHRSDQNTICGHDFLIRDFKSNKAELPYGYITHTIPTGMYKDDGWKDKLIELLTTEYGYELNQIHLLSDIVGKPATSSSSTTKTTHTRTKYEGLHSMGYKIRFNDYDLGQYKMRIFGEDDYFVPVTLIKKHRYMICEFMKCVQYMEKTFNFHMENLYAVPQAFIDKIANTEEYEKRSLIDKIRMSFKDFVIPRIPEKYSIVINFFYGPNRYLNENEISFIEERMEDAKLVTPFMKLDQEICQKRSLVQSIRDVIGDLNIKTQTVDMSNIDYLYKIIGERKEARKFFDRLWIDKESVQYKARILKLIKFYIQNSEDGIDGIFDEKEIQENENNSSEE